MIESHRWLMVNISVCQPLIVITVNYNSLLEVENCSTNPRAENCNNLWKLRKVSETWRHEREISLIKDEISVVSPKKLLNKESN